MRLMVAIADSTSAPTLLGLLTVQMQTEGRATLSNTVIDESKKRVRHVLIIVYHTAPSPVNDNAPKPMLYANKIS